MSMVGSVHGPYKVDVMEDNPLSPVTTVYAVYDPDGVAISVSVYQYQAMGLCEHLNKAYLRGWYDKQYSCCDRSPGPSESLGEGESSVSDSQEVDSV